MMRRILARLAARWHTRETTSIERHLLSENQKLRRKMNSQRADSDKRIRQLESEIAELEELRIPKLEKQIEILETERKTLEVVTARDRKRLEADIAASALKIAEVQ